MWLYFRRFRFDSFFIKKTQLYIIYCLNIFKTIIFYSYEKEFISWQKWNRTITSLCYFLKFFKKNFMIKWNKIIIIIIELVDLWFGWNAKWKKRIDYNYLFVVFNFNLMMMIQWPGVTSLRGYKPVPDQPNRIRETLKGYK